MNSKKILITVKRSSNRKTLIIFEDDGPGVPADKRNDVIKAFYT